ncbi:hypothetical protein B296_00008921, partial [Ensete ventricosum]
NVIGPSKITSKAHRISSPIITPCDAQQWPPLPSSPSASTPPSSASLGDPLRSHRSPTHSQPQLRSTWVSHFIFRRGFPDLMRSFYLAFLFGEQRLDRFRPFCSSMAASSSEPKESPSNNPGLQTQLDDATKGYFLQQTLQAYFPCQLCSTQGNLICAEQNTSLAPSNPTERTVWTFGQKATLELTQ